MSKPLNKATYRPGGGGTWDLGEGPYSSTLEAWKATWVCDGCGETVRCLATDPSHREYGPIYLCQPCITAILEGTDA